MDQQSSPEGLWLGQIKADSGDPVSIDVSEAEAKLRDDSRHVSVPLDNGAVWIGLSSQDETGMHGAYIQPSNQIGGQRLAHWVRLSESVEGRWTGTAKPLAREFSVFMDIARDDADKLEATLINPQRNITGPARQYDVVGDSDEGYQLTVKDSADAFSTARLSETSNTLQMDYGPIPNFEFRLIEKQDPLASAFYGTPPLEALSAPARRLDWPVGSLEDAGFDRMILTGLVNDLRGDIEGKAHPDLVHSLLIAHEGQLIVEEYFRGYTADDPHDIRSAGKTFASILVGVLIEDGHDLTDNTPVNDYISLANEPTGDAVTIQDLLTHRSGLDCYDGNSSSAGNEDAMWQQSDHPNFWTFAANLNFVSAPGEKYAYCSAGINLVGAVLSGASNESVLYLLQSRLFEPLGFENADWNVMPDGDAYLGGGAFLRPRDILKIGQLYLDGGQWRGEQIVDEAWVKASIQPLADITPTTTGLSENEFKRFYFGGTDGLAWHLHKIIVGERVVQSYEASGNGGQIVVVVPEFDLVVAMTGGNYGQGFVWGQWRQTIIGDRIIKAIELE